MDLVNASVDFSLGLNLENLTLSGSAANGQGNEVNNVILGTDNANILGGAAGNDRLVGNGGNDELNGDDARALANIGAFRVVQARDLSDHDDGRAQDTLDHLKDEGLVQVIPMESRDRDIVALTEEGRELLVEDPAGDSRCGGEQSSWRPACQARA